MRGCEPLVLVEAPRLRTYFPNDDSRVRDNYGGLARSTLPLVSCGVRS
jgi:hypothetical protein